MLIRAISVQLWHSWTSLLLYMLDGRNGNHQVKTFAIHLMVFRLFCWWNEILPTHLVCLLSCCKVIYFSKYYKNSNGSCNFLFLGWLDRQGNTKFFPTFCFFIFSWETHKKNQNWVSCHKGEQIANFCFKVHVFGPK